MENGRFDIARSHLLVVLVSGAGEDILTRTSLPPRNLGYSGSTKEMLRSGSREKV